MATINLTEGMSILEMKVCRTRHPTGKPTTGRLPGRLFIFFLAFLHSFLILEPQGQAGSVRSRRVDNRYAYGSELMVAARHACPGLRDRFMP